MKAYNPKFSEAGLFICTKCGKDFDKPEYAEKLKSKLREKLKETGAHKEVRVMVSGCLGVCEKEQQAYGYFPNNGPIELYATDDSYEDAFDEILNLIKMEKASD